MAITVKLLRDRDSLLAFRTMQNEDKTIGLEIYETDEHLSNSKYVARYQLTGDYTESEFHTGLRKSFKENELVTCMCTNPEWNPDQQEAE